MRALIYVRMEAIKPPSAGSVLANLRWSKASEAERKAIGKALAEARWAKRRKAKKGATK